MVATGRVLACFSDGCIDHSVGCWLCSTKFDSSVDRGSPFQFTIGIGQVIKGWDEGVMQMSLGEKATLNISSDYGYGSRGAGGVSTFAPFLSPPPLLAVPSRWDAARPRGARPTRGVDDDLVFRCT
eukprot:COSAG01_NODE_884_length_12927_cov_8.148191_2_plen_126_part_00